MRPAEGIGKYVEDVKMLQNSFTAERNDRNYKNELGISNQNPAHKRISHLSVNEIALSFWPHGCTCKRAKYLVNYRWVPCVNSK